MAKPNEKSGFTAHEMLAQEWGYLPPADTPDELDDISLAAANAGFDLASESLTDTEQESATPSDLVPPPETSALCLSGGGIRSATFGLGVMQGLAEAEALERFNYLSTASGGGFIASWLARWRADAHDSGTAWKQEDLWETPDAYSGSFDELHPVRRLRSFSNYLAPRVGATQDSLSFVNSALRKFGFNLLTWLLVMIAIAALCRAIIAIAAIISNISFLQVFDIEADSFWADPVYATTFAIPLILALIAGFLTFLTLCLQRSDYIGQEQFSAIIARWVLVCFGWLAIFGLFAAIPEYLWDLGTIARANLGTLDQGAFITFTVAVSGLLTAILGFWAKIPQDVQAHARGFANRAKVYTLELASIATLAAFAIGSGYFLRWAYSRTWFEGSVNMKALLPAVPCSGDKAACEGFEKVDEKFAQLKEAYQGVCEAELAQAAAKGDSATLISCTGSKVQTAQDKLDTALADFNQASRSFEVSQYVENGPEIIASAILLSLIAVACAYVDGVNRSSLHSIYSVRLVRAFLGSARRVRNPSQPSGFDQNDDLALHKMRYRDANGHLQLFPVINMTLNLNRGRGERNDWQQRKGAPFIATPLFVGSPALNTLEDATTSPAPPDGRGYFPTYRLDENGNKIGFPAMTLGRAMTISGAAASPNMGYYSRPIVMAAMALLNIRLGWWFPNPRYPDLETGWRGSTVNEPPGGLLYFLKEAAGSLRDKDRYLYLSDGGHFDNLGLYEMVRRRCRRILVIDAGADPDFKYDDLLSTVRKIQVDFGIPIDLPTSLPGQEGPGKDQRFVTAPIRYNIANDKHENGILIVLKPMLKGNEPPGLLRYREESRANNGEFPHHSTTDQFYDESQFESYRQLGAVSARELCAEIGGSSFDPGADLPDKPYPGGGGTVDQQAHDIKATARGALAATPKRTSKGADSGQADEGSGGSLSTMLEALTGVLENMSGGELLVKTVGAVAAATVTVTVTSEAVQGAPDVLTELAEKIAPGTKTVKKPRPQVTLEDPADLPVEPPVEEPPIIDPPIVDPPIVDPPIVDPPDDPPDSELAIVVGRLRNQITGLEGRMTRLENGSTSPTLTDLQRELAALRTQVSDLAEAEQNQEARLSQKLQGIDALQRQVNALRRRLAAVSN